MKKSFIVFNVTPVYGDNGEVFLNFIDAVTGERLKSSRIIKTKEYEGSWLVHETENEYLLEERGRNAKD